MRVLVHAGTTNEHRDERKLYSLFTLHDSILGNTGQTTHATAFAFDSVNSGSQESNNVAGITNVY